VARDLKPGDVQEAEIVDLAHDGRGIARDAEGKTVFIDGGAANSTKPAWSMC